MKLLVITFDWPPMRGGKATLLHELFTRLNEEKFVIAAKHGNYGGIDKGNDFQTLRIPKFFFNLPLPPSFRPYFIKVAMLYFVSKKALQKFRPDVVVCCQLLTEGAVGLYLKKEFGIPYIVYTYDTIDVEQPLNGKDMEIATEILKNAEKVVCISSFMAEKLVAIGIEEEKTVLVHPGVDVEQFKPKKPSEKIAERTGYGKKRIMLSVARLVDRKGLDYAIRAFVDVRKDIKDLRYFIVGDGPEKNKLEKLAEELGVKEDVVFAGEVGNDELVDYYNACDVFVLPSIVSEKEFKSEGFGIVFLEANACGKPVVGTRVSGIVDAVAENESGLLVEQRNVGQLAAAIKKILSDKRLAEKLGKKGRERAMEKFSWDAVAENFGVNVLQKIEPGK